MSSARCFPPCHPLAAGFSEFHLSDEGYWRMTGNLAAANAQVLANSIEEGAPTPQMSAREVGAGRVFVSVPDHFTWTHDGPLYRNLILRGMKWTAKKPRDRLAPLSVIGARVEKERMVKLKRGVVLSTDLRTFVRARKPIFPYSRYMSPIQEHAMRLTRRRFLRGAALSLGVPALHTLLSNIGLAAEARRGLPGLPHFAPKAKRVIYLMQTGGPSHVDLFDDKPELHRQRGQDIPESVLGGLRLTTMTANQKAKPCLPAAFGGKQRGECGMWVSDLLPHTAGIVDDLCFIRSMHGEQINHAPAVTHMLTGHNLPGRPSAGAWLTYGLGTETEELPGFVVLTSRDQEASCGQFFYDFYWGAGFLPGKFQGVPFRGGGDPVLFLSNPDGMSRDLRRAMLDGLDEMNHFAYERLGDPETLTRVAQYEMAFKMQASVPELTDLSREPRSVLDLYGPDVNRKGSFAYNCLLARRMAERGVRFIQLMHAGWDQHGNLPMQLPIQCRDTDQPSAALVQDLKSRGLLEDTLVIWGGEFGRTPFVQGDISNPKAHGRDHHPRAFTMWLAGGGVKRGCIYGASDEFGYHAVENPVHVHDLQATLLHLCGIDHERLTYKHQGLDFRLTGVETAHVVKDIIA